MLWLILTYVFDADPDRDTDDDVLVWIEPKEELEDV